MLILTGLRGRYFSPGQYGFLLARRSPLQRRHFPCAGVDDASLFIMRWRRRLYRWPLAAISAAAGHRSRQVGADDFAG